MNAPFVQNENGTVTEAIGYLDCGGFIIPRAELAEALPDIERFERCLEQAKFVSRYMSEHSGAMPATFTTLSYAARKDVAATLRELGRLAASAAERLAHERRGRP